MEETSLPVSHCSIFGHHPVRVGRRQSLETGYWFENTLDDHCIDWQLKVAQGQNGQRMLRRMEHNVAAYPL
jgi:hypothetical protein